jgi:hypothetical protein
MGDDDRSLLCAMKPEPSRRHRIADAAEGQ